MRIPLAVAGIAFLAIPLFAGNSYRDKLLKEFDFAYRTLSRKRLLCSNAREVYKWLREHIEEAVCAIWGVESSWRTKVSASITGDYCPLQVNKRAWEKVLKKWGVLKDWKGINDPHICLRAALIALLRNISIFCCTKRRLCNELKRKNKFLYFLALHNTPSKINYQYLLQVLKKWKECKNQLKKFPI